MRGAAPITDARASAADARCSAAAAAAAAAAATTCAVWAPRRAVPRRTAVRGRQRAQPSPRSSARVARRAARRVRRDARDRRARRRRPVDLGLRDGFHDLAPPASDDPGRRTFTRRPRTAAPCAPPDVRAQRRLDVGANARTSSPRDVDAAELASGRTAEPMPPSTSMGAPTTRPPSSRAFDRPSSRCPHRDGHEQRSSLGLRDLLGCRSCASRTAASAFAWSTPRARVDQGLHDRCRANEPRSRRGREAAIRDRRSLFARSTFARVDQRLHDLESPFSRRLVQRRAPRSSFAWWFARAPISARTTSRCPYLRDKRTAARNPPSPETRSAIRARRWRLRDLEVPVLCRDEQRREAAAGRSRG